MIKQLHYSFHNSGYVDQSIIMERKGHDFLDYDFNCQQQIFVLAMWKGSCT